MDEEQLLNIKWNDISITRNNIKGESILVVLIFPDWKSGHDFLTDILSKNKFAFGININLYAVAI